MIPSTSRLGQDTTAAVSSSSTPGWTATWSCQAVSNWSSASGTSWPPTRAVSSNRRAAPQHISSVPGVPAQWPQPPTAVGASGGPAVKRSPSAAAGMDGTGSSGSRACHRCAT